MRCGKKLNASEKKQSLELKQQIRRSRKVIHNFLKNVEDYGKKKCTGRPSSLSDRDKWAILRVVSNPQLTQTKLLTKILRGQNWKRNLRQQRNIK